MSVSTLTLALATFNELDVRAIDVGKENQKFYQIFYKKDGKMRVMLVPKKATSFELLQYEVASLLNRSIAAQQEHGHKDGYLVH